MIFAKGRLEAGEWILILAGGSGVGSAAIQLARLVGANIITTAGSDEKVEKAKTLGAHRSEEHTSELQSLAYLVCRLLLEKKKKTPRGEKTVCKLASSRAEY